MHIIHEDKVIVKYTNLFKLLSSELPVIKDKNSLWNTMITRSEIKARTNPRNNVFTDFKNTPS